MAQRIYCVTHDVLDLLSRAIEDKLKRWKYSAVMSFLDPFVTPREASGKVVTWGGGARRTGLQRTKMQDQQKKSSRAIRD